MAALIVSAVCHGIAGVIFTRRFSRLESARRADLHKLYSNPHIDPL